MSYKICMFCLLRTTFPKKSVPVLHFLKNPSLFRLRTQLLKGSFQVLFRYLVFIKTTRIRSVLYPCSNSKVDPFMLRSRSRTWVWERNMYGFRSLTPESGLTARQNSFVVLSLISFYVPIVNSRLN